MIRDYVYDVLESEISRQTQMLEAAQNELATAPDGFLYVRETGRSYTCYQVIRTDGKVTHHNIKGNRKLIRRLLKKTENRRLQRICRNNVKIINWDGNQDKYFIMPFHRGDLSQWQA